jgi:hypothetical protein
MPFVDTIYEAVIHALLGLLKSTQSTEIRVVFTCWRNPCLEREWSDLKEFYILISYLKLYYIIIFYNNV